MMRLGFWSIFWHTDNNEPSGLMLLAIQAPTMCFRPLIVRPVMHDTCESAIGFDMLVISHVQLSMPLEQVRPP